MADSGSLLTYRKRPGCKNTGYEFELLVSMLLVVRSEMNAENFNFTVHNLDAGDLDDIVFTIKDNESKQHNGYFMQLKYTTSKQEKNEIKRQEMLEQSGDYSLIRYYPSYLEIKDKFSNIQNKNLIIYTNTSMHTSASNNNLNEVTDGTGDLIHTGGRIFTFTQESEEYKAFDHVQPYKDKLQELSNNLDKLKKLSDKLNELSDNLAKLEKSSDKFDNLEEFSDKLEELSRNLDELLDRFEELSEKLEELSGKLKELSDKLVELSDKLDNLEELPNNLESSDELDKIEKLSQKLDNLKKLSEKKNEENFDKMRNEVYKMKMAHSRQLKNVKRNIFKKKLQEVLNQVLEWDLDTWNEFIGSLKVYTDQLSMKELTDLVKGEYEELCGTSKTFLEFKKSMTSWREENLCLTKNLSFFWKDVLQMQRIDLMSAISSKMKPIEKLTFKHKENINIFENHPHRIMQIVCAGTTNISCLKVQQNLSNSDYLLLDINTLQGNLKEVLFVWRHYQILIVVVDSTFGKRRDDEIAEQLEDVLCSDSNKKIIFITNSTNHLNIRFQHYQTIPLSEDFKFNQLTCRSQEIVLDCQVDFQGHPVNLRSLVSNTDDVPITADLIMKVLSREKVTVGYNHFPEINWEPSAETDIFYIPRLLQQREIVNESMFKSIGNDCLAFSDVTLPEVISLLPDNTDVQELLEGHEVNENVNIFILKENSSFKKLCEKYEKVHWIKKKGESFVWWESKGDITLIQNNLKQNADPMIYVNIRDILGDFRPVTLIAAEPGMGKEVEMLHLTRILKEENHATWVFNLNLNNHKDILGSDSAADTTASYDIDNRVSGSQILRQTSLSETTHELLRRAGNFNTKFEENLFWHELSYGGNIVVIVSGFDEVSSDCLEKAIDIVKEIISTNVRKVFITCRRMSQEKLENSFSCLAFSLQPLSDEDQIELLQNVWHVPGMSTHYDSAAFATELRHLYKDCMGIDIMQFTSSPLHAKILGEVFKCEAKAFSEHGKIRSTLSIDLLKPYVGFVDEKWKAYCKKYNVNLKTFSMRQNAEEWKKDSMSIAKICSVVAFLNKDDFMQLNKSDKLFKECVEGIKGGKEKLGILKNIMQGKPEFVDRNLMAYFVAVWLSENYDHNRKFIMNKLFDTKWKTVTAFLNRILCKDFKLHIAVLNKDLSIIKHLLSTPGVKVDERDLGGRTPLHLAAISCSEEIVDKLLEHGARSDIKDRWFGWKPLKFAEEVTFLHAIKVLQKKS